MALLLKRLVIVPNSGCPRWGFLRLLPRIRQGGIYGIVFPLCSISSSQHPTSPVPSRTCQSPRVCFGANGFRKVPINLSCSSALLGMLLALLASTALRGGFSIPVTKIYFVQAFSYAGERKGGKATWNQLSAQWKLAWPGWGARGDSGLFPTNCCGDKHRDLVPNRMNRGAGKKIKGKKIPGKVKTFRHSIFCNEFVFVLKGH